MTAFYYFYQNASVFCFLVQIRASAVLILAEISNLNMNVIIKCTLIVLFKYMTPSYKWPIASLRNEEGSVASLDINTF